MPPIRKARRTPTNKVTNRCNIVDIQLNPKNCLKILEQETKPIINKNNFFFNLCEKSCKNSFNNNKTIKNSISPNKICSFNRKNKTSCNTIFNTNNNNVENNNNNNSSNRGISIRLNFKNKIINLIQI